MSINNTTTTGGFYGVNGNLNIQGAINASSFSYYDSSGISHDITQSLENAVDTITDQTIEGTQTFSNQIVLNNGSTTLKASGLWWSHYSFGKFHIINNWWLVPIVRLFLQYFFKVE